MKFMAAHLRRERDAPTVATPFALYRIMYKPGQRVWPQGRVASSRPNSTLRSFCRSLLDGRQTVHVTNRNRPGRRDPNLTLQLGSVTPRWVTDTLGRHSHNIKTRRWCPCCTLDPGVMPSWKAGPLGLRE